MVGIRFEIFLVLSVLIFASLAAFSADIDRVNIVPEKIFPESGFYLKAYLDGDSCRTSARFYVDGVMYSSKIAGCDASYVQSNEIRPSKINLECGVHSAKVELVEGERIVDTLERDFDVGVKPVIEFLDCPQPNKAFRIKFTNNDTGEPLNRLMIRIYNARLGRASDETFSSDVEGIVKATVKDIGEYRLEIFDSDDYCATTSFYAKKDYIVQWPESQNPVVGELLHLVVPSGVGVKVLDSDGRLYLAGNTSLGGGVNLTINDAGDYTIVVGELSGVYLCKNKSITIVGKNTPVLSVSPENPVSGEDVVVRLEVDGQPIRDAAVNVVIPGGEKQPYTTNAEGAFVLPSAATGRYIVSFEAERYSPTERVFETKSLLKTDVIPKDAAVGQEVSIFVRDQYNNLVSGATASVEDVAYGLTGVDGKFTFTLPDARTYSASITKEGFWDASETVNAYSPLRLETSASVIEIGEGVKIKVYDNRDRPVDAEVEVRKPDLDVDALGAASENEYTPINVGAYKITASKEGYGRATSDLVVTARPLDLDLSLDGDTVTVSLTSYGRPVEGITIEVDRPGGTQENKSDAEGRMSFVVKKAGLLKVSANTDGTNLLYKTASIDRQIYERRDVDSLAVAILVIIVGVVVSFWAVQSIPGGRIPGKRAESGLRARPERPAAAKKGRYDSYHSKKGGGRSKLSP